MPTMAIETNYAKFNWFPSGLPLYLNLVPAILQLIVVLSNIFVVVIFLRKKMYRGINVILIGMATADAACVFLLMVSYWFALVLHIHSSGSFSENQVHFLCVTYKYGTSVSITFNMVSIWLMVCLGVVKFLLVRFPLQAKNMMTTGRLLFATLLVYVIAILFTFPHYVTDNYDMSAKIYYGKSKEQDIFYCAIRRKRDGDFVLYLENDARLVRCICVHLIPIVVLLCTNSFFCYKLGRKNGIINPSPKFIRSVKIVCALTFIYLLSEIPFTVFFCLQYYMTVTEKPISFLVTNFLYITFTLYLLRFLNYLSNFWVYLVLNKKFRQTCCSLFCRRS